MLVASQERVHFHEMTDRINRCPLQNFGKNPFRIGRDAEDGKILQGQRNSVVHLSSTRPFERFFLFSAYPCH